MNVGLQAVAQGRWLLIEDINMAPAEVLAGLVPLLEARQLPLPQRGEVVRATAGFQLLASVTTAPGGASHSSVGKTAAPGRSKATLCGGCTRLHCSYVNLISVFLDAVTPAESLQLPPLLQTCSHFVVLKCFWVAAHAQHPRCPPTPSPPPLGHLSQSLLQTAAFTVTAAAPRLCRARCEDVCLLMARHMPR